MRPLLSKSTYVYGLQCHKRFYLNKFHKDFANPEDEQTQAIFQRGTDVGELAQKLFPGGVNAQGDEEWHSEITAKRTTELLPDHDIIYEAAFIYNEVICAVDILIRKGNQYYAFEVKSTNILKEQHIEDAALQYYVLSNCGISIADFSIVHFNRDYVKIGDLDVNQLFKAVSVLEEVEAKQAYIGKNIAVLKKLLKLKEIPEIEMGKQCDKPYPCNFSEYCLSLIPPSLEVKPELDPTIHIDRDAWKEFAEGFQYPLYFFDFETVMYGVPEFDFSRPYQQIPFQYSLHWQDAISVPGSPLGHTEYLGYGVTDPRPDLIKQLIQDLGNTGSIVTWNISFEKGVLKKLAIDFPEYEVELNSIINRLVDLMPPFRPNRIVYSEAFGGSYSIKNVLPVIVPELSYGDLNIQEGGTASFQYGQMQFLEPDAREQLRKDLLEYCHLDTLAMVRIWERVNEFNYFENI